MRRVTLTGLRLLPKNLFESLQRPAQTHRKGWTAMGRCVPRSALSLGPHKVASGWQYRVYGRMDDQVKIRGFRIELGEIESHLLKLPTIKQALVMAREGKHQDKYLCAYIAAERSITVQQIKEMLSETLPGYMIPSSFVFLDSIPLTPNGKVDRRALPEPGEEAYSGKKYAILSRTEEIMVEVWKEV